MSTIFHTILPERAFNHKIVPGPHAKQSRPRQSIVAVVLILLSITFLSFTGSGCGGSVSTETAAPVSPEPGPGTGVATLAWNAPTTNVDGSPLTDLAGYKIYYGVSPGVYSTSIDVGSNTSHQVGNLTVGTTYYFTVTAYNTTGNESDFATPPVSKTIN
jgi:hypothetical protein